MRYLFRLVIIIFFIGGLFFVPGCKDDGSTDPSEEKPDPRLTPIASGLVSIDDATFFCRYNSPFGFGAASVGKVQPECKAYNGTDWTKEDASENCAKPFGPTIAVISELSILPCDTGLSLAACTSGLDATNTTITYFYEVDPPPVGDEDPLDLGSVKSGCEGPGEGIYEGEPADATPSSPLLPEAITACSSTATVTVTPENITNEQRADYRENGGHILFKQKTGTPKAGLIIYPGGRIDSRAFAPAAQILANKEIAVAILPVPDFMAISKAAEDRPTAVIEAAENSDIYHWFILGHSVGGVAASIYVYNSPDLAPTTSEKVKGLVILGSYLSSDTPLQTRDELTAMIILSSLESSAIPGTDNYNNYIAGQDYAPSATTYEIITGGNHFGFCYQENTRDNEDPTISVAEQHTQYTNLIINMIDTALANMDLE